MSENTEESPTPPPPPPHVLVVDDSHLCIKIVKKILSAAGATHEAAFNGREAVDKLAQSPLRFDAVLMDIRMPVRQVARTLMSWTTRALLIRLFPSSRACTTQVMDGMEATRHIRGVLGLTRLPVIALSAEIGSDIREAILDAGANCLVSKPANASEIVQTLQVHIEAAATAAAAEAAAEKGEGEHRPRFAAAFHAAGRT
jgi:hypothetical protein